MENLSEKQCRKLDEMLASFGADDYLDRESILDLFQNDENLAASYIDILVRNSLVEEVGQTTDSKIPMSLLRESSVSLFVENGGFSKLYIDREKAVSTNKISEENIKLQNENLKHAKTIREQEQRIRDYDEQNKFFEVVKNYWWLLGVLYGLGLLTAKYII